MTGRRSIAALINCLLYGATSAAVLVACGDGGGTAARPPAALTGTLAYVVSECRQKGATGYFLHQAVQIRRGDRGPITITEVPDIGPISVPGLCAFISSARYGANSPLFGAVQRLAVSVDGSTAAFEINDAFSAASLPADSKGLFVVRADGTGLRRLGPPSRQSSFVASSGFYFNDLAFSPDSRTLAFPDQGPGPDGVEASQVFLQDVSSGTRTQITRLPVPAAHAADVPRDLPSVFLPRFLDGQTVGFFTDTNVEAQNLEGEIVGASVKTDGSRLKLVRVVALPGSKINPTFIITGDHPVAVVLIVPGEPVNHPVNSGINSIFEVFLPDGDNLLQLTNFHRADTGSAGIGVDGQTVFFVASADPFGDNSSENCQLFSVDRTGSNLRQLTHFHETDRSLHGCDFNSPLGTGCAIQIVGQDAATETLLFYSSCDPFGTNPGGGQIFAAGPDGSNLRQLTETHGLITEFDGTVSGELPGPFAFSGGFL